MMFVIWSSGFKEWSQFLRTEPWLSAAGRLWEIPIVIFLSIWLFLLVIAASCEYSAMTDRYWRSFLAGITGVIGKCR